MSKVLKSSTVIMQMPFIIETGGDFIATTSQEDLLFEQDADVEETLLDAGTNLDLVRQQTRDILTETEQMVKDLIETARVEAERIVGKSKEEADTILNQAKLNADQITKDAEDNKKNIEENGFNKGYSEGFMQGEKQAQEDHAEKLAQANETLELANEERKNTIIAAEKEIVQLALAVARKIVKQEVLTAPEFIIKVVKSAIQKATDREEIAVRVAPDQLDTVIMAKDEIHQSTKGIKNLKIVADTMLEPGGCVVDTSNGTVDARVERQLDEIEESMMEVAPNA